MGIYTDDLLPCTRCGICCFSEAPDYLQVLGIDYERLGDDAGTLTQFIENRAYMKLEDGHCIALRVHADGRFLCSIYERRPDVCHSLERGSGACRGEIATKADRAASAQSKLVTLSVRAPDTKESGPPS
jgi:Fe-S-cluster containining protein